MATFRVAFDNSKQGVAGTWRPVRAIVYPEGRAPRGSEYTLEDMYEAGAAIKAFYVFAAQQ